MAQRGAMALIWLSALALLRSSTAAPFLEPAQALYSKQQGPASRGLLQQETQAAESGSAVVREFLTSTFADQPPILQRVQDRWDQHSGEQGYGHLTDHSTSPHPETRQTLCRAPCRPPGGPPAAR
jgi:hypothetical protein